MADSCFHNLKEGGIPRQLAEGLSARVFPGEHLMLSVVEIQPGRSPRCTRTPTSSGGCASRGSGSASRTASSIPSRRETSGRRRRTCRTGGVRPTSGRSCSTSFRRRGRSTRRPAPGTRKEEGGRGQGAGRAAAAPLFDTPLTGSGRRPPRPLPRARPRLLMFPDPPSRRSFSHRHRGWLSVG